MGPELFPERSLKQYGEYPDNSGRFYGLPINQDAYGMMYRRDLFENPQEQAALRLK